MTATASRIPLLRRRRQAMDRCAAALNLCNVLGTFIASSSSRPVLDNSTKFVASCRSALATALAGSDDAVLAVRKAIQSASPDAGV